MFRFPLSRTAMARIGRTSGLMALLTIASACATLPDPELQLRPDFDFSYAEHTPGAGFMSDASRNHDAGQYEAALSKYMQAAHWADKFAQFNIGVMHLKGQGTPFDPARALAWFRLANERGYPMVQALVDDLEVLLDERTRRQADRILAEELEPRYGDAVAIERTHERMRRDRRFVTGSRVGFAGFLTIVDRNGFTRDGSEFYAREKWDFRHIVRMETQLMRDLGDGRVELRELELDDEPTPTDRP